MEIQEELNYLLSFVDESSFDQEVACDQLICLWTAYCLHRNMDVDTLTYDTQIQKIWDRVLSNEPDPAFWGDFEAFYNSLSKHLV